jgi:hypothetical protein
MMLPRILRIVLVLRFASYTCQSFGVARSHIHSSMTTATSPQQLLPSLHSSTALSARRSSNNNNSNEAPLSSSSPKADFAYQELQVQLDAMQRAQVPSRDLSTLKQLELLDYCQQIALHRPSSVPLDASLAKQLPGTKWRLAFSTEASIREALPRDATVYLSFTSPTQLNYVLQFGEKTFGLQKMTAVSSWQMDHQGFVEYQYEKVTTDAFGFSNVGIGMLGMLQGRTSYIYTAYYDGQLWIELGVDAKGKNYASVHVREGDAWK